MTSPDDRQHVFDAVQESLRSLTGSPRLLLLTPPDELAAAMPSRWRDDFLRDEPVRYDLTCQLRGDVYRRPLLEVIDCPSEDDDGDDGVGGCVDAARWPVPFRRSQLRSDWRDD